MAKLQAASMPIAKGGQLCAWGSYATGQTDGRIMISLNAPYGIIIIITVA